MVTCIHLDASNGSASFSMEDPRLDAIRLTLKVIVSGIRIQRCVEYRMHNINEITNDVMHDIGSDITPDII